MRRSADLLLRRGGGTDNAVGEDRLVQARDGAIVRGRVILAGLCEGVVTGPIQHPGDDQGRNDDGHNDCQHDAGGVEKKCLLMPRDRSLWIENAILTAAPDEEHRAGDKPSNDSGSNSHHVHRFSGGR